jgi:hypothetical protein
VVRIVRIWYNIELILGQCRHCCEHEAGEVSDLSQLVTVRLVANALLSLFIDLKPHPVKN